MTLPRRVPQWWPYGKEFPDWRVWKGIANDFLYASFDNADPALVVRGDNAAVLRDKILRAVEDHRSWWEAR
jgi:hypothetical protein